MIHRTGIGLDVYARSIKSAAFIPETGEILEKGFECDPCALAKRTKKLPQLVRCVYESGPTGFCLQRKLAERNIDSVVGAVSKMLRPSGGRAKTDKRDAIFLARMLAVGSIVEVAAPAPAISCRSSCFARGHRLRKSQVRMDEDAQ